MEMLPHAVLIWTFLLLVVAATAVVMALPRVPGPRLAAPSASFETDDERYAGEVAVAAERAAATAQRLRDEWTGAQQAVESAWSAYDEADRAARRTAAATAYPVMRRRRARGENTDRERFLHRRALASCRQREISIAQLNDALAHRGWNPRLHPAAQESALSQAVRDHRFAGYQAATARERAAWEAAEQAAEALRSLRAEACAAAVLVGARQDADAGWWADQWTTTEPIRPTTEPVRITTEPIRPTTEPVRPTPAAAGV